jgi:hypothetical protein
MRVIVKFHETVRPRIVAWVATLATDPADARPFADVMLDELKRRLVRAGGLPADAVRDDRTTPPTYWCELGGRAWVRYALTDQKRALGGVKSKTAEIIGLEQHPPPAATPSSPRS